MDAGEVRAQYAQVVPLLEEIEASLVEWLRSLVNGLGLHEPQISSRTKDVHSFVMKFLVKGYADPLREASDKVGLRVDVAYLDEIDLLIEAVKASDVVDVIEVDRKIDGLETDEQRVNTLVYPGVNVDIVPMTLPEGILQEWAMCELQVRTLGQAAWAVGGHDLTYKPPEGVQVPWQLGRKVQRLTAMQEIFDEAMKDVRDQVLGDDGYPVAIIVQALRQLWVRFSTRDFSLSATRWLVGELLPADMGGQAATQLAAQLREFVDAKEDKLRIIYERGGPELLLQPESLLIFLLIDQGRNAFGRTWEQVDLPWILGEEMGTAWGVSIPVPQH